MFKKIAFVVSILFFIAVTAWGSINGYRSFMIGFASFTAITVCFGYSNEQLKKYAENNDRRKPFRISDLKERPHKVCAIWTACNGEKHGLFLPLVYEGEDWDPDIFFPMIVNLHHNTPDSIYVEPLLSANRNYVIEFAEFDKDRIIKTPYGERMKLPPVGMQSES